AKLQVGRKACLSPTISAMRPCEIDAPRIDALNVLEPRRQDRLANLPCQAVSRSTQLVRRHPAERRLRQQLLVLTQPALLDQEQPALLQRFSVLAGEGALPLRRGGFARQDAEATLATSG